MAEHPKERCELDADRLILRLDRTVPGRREAIAPVVEEILEAVLEMGCGRGKEAEIELVLHEALANAVIHGCGEDPDKEAEICVACDEARGILIVVRDPGPGFDPSRLPSPVVGENLFSDHGRGIYLINRLVDEVRFERNGTEIWIRKR